MHREEGVGEEAGSEGEGVGARLPFTLVLLLSEMSTIENGNHRVEKSTVAR